MTKPLRHRRCEIENAARIAADMGLPVRLEADGAITILPKDTVDKKEKAIGNSLSAWRERHGEGRTGGRA